VANKITPRKKIINLCLDDYPQVLKQQETTERRPANQPDKAQLKRRNQRDETFGIAIRSLARHLGLQLGA
jgi:hypothetical protein